MLDNNVRDWFGFDKVAGDIGVEIELEGRRAPFPIAAKGWRSEHDGSLRGEYAIEYVTNGAIPIDQVGTAIDRLKTRIDNSDVQVVDSIRAGVHIHVNCHDMTLKQVFNFAFVYLAMEHALVKYCGDDREGNLFCLRASDAEYLPYLIQHAYEGDRLNTLNTMDIRYSSLNFQSLFKFGTLEFRAMKTFTDLRRIKEWAHILYNIKQYSMTIDHPRQIAEDISFNSPELWVSNAVGAEYFNLIKYRDLENDVMNDLRRIQPILYGA